MKKKIAIATKKPVGKKVQKARLASIAPVGGK
jgi:hypothetical protein